MSTSARIVVATDREWPIDQPSMPDLARAASSIARLEVCHLGSGAWQMSPEWLVESARQPPADVVVVAPEGPLRGTAAGEAVKQLLRAVRCPVLVARREARLGRVLLTTSIERAALPALGPRCPLAPPARLRFLPSVEHLPQARPLQATTAAGSADETERPSPICEARFARLLGALGYGREVHVIEGRPGSTIDSDAERVGADLIVVAAELGSGFWGRRMESPAETVAFASRCSVLIVHAAGPPLSQGRTAGR